MPTRREFLLQSGALVGAGVSLPWWLPRGLAADADTLAGRVLVLIHLAGGNDSLNTLIPYTDPLYYQHRQRLAIPREQVLPLDARLGLHPSLAPWQALFKAGRLAIVQQVGYPNLSRSHFLASDIWQTGSSTEPFGSGWIARYHDAVPAPEADFAAIGIGSHLPLALRGGRRPVPSLRNLDDFRFFPRDNPAQRVDDLATFEELHGIVADRWPAAAVIAARMRDALASTKHLHAAVGEYKTPITYPNTELGRQLQLVAQIIASPLGVGTFHLVLGGFDTHAAQAPQHARLLTQLGQATDAFLKDLDTMSRADRVVTAIYSEFGRRVEENASAGTDHGGATHVYLLGAPVRGGLIGEPPALAAEALDQGGLAWQIDFRRVYATLLERWLGCPAEQVLGETFPLLPFLS
jgi:uncharacterized protein (DUF1501 family)